MRLLNRLFNTFLDFLFPRYCLGCKSEGVSLCENCLAKIPPAIKEPDDFIVSVFDYDNKIIKQAIWLLKYSGRRSLAEDLAKPLYEHLIAELEDRLIFENFTNPLLVPVPLSRQRLQKRGYNQSVLLIKELIKIDCGRNFQANLGLLKKIRNTKPQAQVLNKEERLKNLRGCFKVKKTNTACNRNIILIDDVATTGATLREARRALTHAGVRKVFALTLAH